MMVESVDEAEQIYALLTDEGEIFMPMEEAFYARRFAMLRDRFGTGFSSARSSSDIRW
jgi:PhnB protein